MRTGYEVSFEDFHQLLSYPDSRRTAAPLVESWFSCRVVPHGEEVALVDAQGALLSPRAVHDAIQADPERQQRLYNTAMTLWR